MADIMNSEISKLIIWLNINKLKLNVKKTHFMIFSPNRNHIVIDTKLYVGTDEIHQVAFTKFLGVILDDKMLWEHHINYIKTKVAKEIGIISKARKYLSKSCMITLYYSFLYPYLSYCVEVWGNATKSRLNCLTVLQKRAVRLITSSGYRDHTLPLFTQLGLLNIENIYRFSLGSFMYKFYHGKLPALFENMFTLIRTVHSRATRQQNHLYVPFARSRFPRQSVRFKGVSVWNSVLKHIDIYCSVHTFKFRLRTVLLSGIKLI